MNGRSNSGLKLAKRNSNHPAMDAERTILAGRAWSLLMDDVATQLLAGRGLAIPNLGVFTFAVRQERMGGASICFPTRS